MKNRLRAVLLSVSVATFLLGCSVLEPPRRSRSVQPQVHDVPMAARPVDMSLRKRLLVLPFIDAREQRRASRGVAEQARRTVVSELTRSGQFLVIQNSDFPQDLSSFLSSGQYNLTSVSQQSQALGVAAVMEGKILDIRARRLSDQVGVFRKVQALIEARVQIRVFSAKTGKELLNTQKSAELTTETTQVGKQQMSDRALEEDPRLIEEVTQKAFRGTVGQIYRSLEKVDWEGRIALVKADRIYLNAGRLSGIQIGDILKVMEKGEDVFDPETGILIGQVPGRMKGTIEVVSYFGKDGAIGVVHSGSGFAENDLVEVY